MTNEEIKEKVELAIAQINNGQNALKALRENCPHEETIEGLWSWRVGNIQPALLCKFCGEKIKNLKRISETY